MFMIVFLLHMTTEVGTTGLRVWFGWAPTYPRIVSIDTIRSVEVVNYRPIADYGFWGVRAGRDGERAFIARGTRGVRLELIDGTKLLDRQPAPRGVGVRARLRTAAGSLRLFDRIASREDSVGQCVQDVTLRKLHHRRARIGSAVIDQVRISGLDNSRGKNHVWHEAVPLEIGRRLEDRSGRPAEHAGRVCRV